MNRRVAIKRFIILGFTGLILSSGLLLSGCKKILNNENSASVDESTYHSTINSSESSQNQDSKDATNNTTESSSETETTPALPPEQQELYSAYQNALTNLLDHSVLPDGKSTNTKADFFSIQNVDEEETEELILAWTTTSSFGNIFHVYQYDIATDTFHVKWNKSSSVKLYDKGTVLIPVPVNYGLSSTDEFYPYGIYQYQNDKNAYTFQAYVDAWQKSYLSADYDGNPYPSNIDTENAGMVYCISYCREGDDYVNDYNYSQSQYDQFCDENFGMQITTDHMMELSSENINSIIK